MNADEAAMAVAPIIGYPPSREQIAMAFLDVDQDAITKAQSKRLKWERWDKESPINNVAAEQIMAARDDYQGGEVYLIYMDGDLMFFQPFDPISGEQMTEENVDKIAKAQVAQLAAEMARDEIVAAIVEHLPSPVVEPTRIPSTIVRREDGSIGMEPARVEVP